MVTRPRRVLLAVLGFFAGCFLTCGRVSAQLVLGQYEDEAPLGTWNTFGLPAAPAVGLGGLQLARAWDASSSLANPALLTDLPRFSMSLSASYGSATLFKYSLVNTGVVTSQGNLGVGVLGLDHGGFAVRAGKWAFGAAVAVTENYHRPGILISSSSYLLTFDQTGCLRVFHAGVARRLLASLSLGLGINVAAGNLVRTTTEQTSDIPRVVTITDDKRESFRGFFLNGGIVWEATPRLTAAAVFRTPFVKRARASSALRYEVPIEGTDILIDAEATNEYRQPWILGTGGSYRFSPAWSVAASLAWFGWSGYEVTYFGEPLSRSFRNIVRGGAGVEYLAPAGAYGRSATVPFRLGFSVDPQPMTEPRSTYLALTFGTGLRWRSLAIDISGSVGRENGSGNSLAARKVVLSVSYIFSDGR